jgi:hypothetical protein
VDALAPPQIASGCGAALYRLAEDRDTGWDVNLLT